LKKILIANRGEIAVRVIRTCRDMGLSAVAVYSACDRNALHVRLADEAYAIGPDAASESYLRIDKLIDAARRSGADAVHPGYGFLAENADFAEACVHAGLTFLGPGADAMRVMGAKTSARDIAVRAGVPVVPGSGQPFAEDLGIGPVADAAQSIGYPLLVKAVAGGGGKGMRVVARPEDLTSALQMARSEARSSFGDGRVYFERQIERPRHVEVQLLGDQHGTVMPFVERECSIQRRHQKLIEETPSPVVGPDLRTRLTEAAAAIGREAGYTSAGTIEFLVDAAGSFYFLEMNTRLQVEHPVTEAVTGLDFVRAQIEIAQGAQMAQLIPSGVSTIAPQGHAIEVRVYAENADEGFLPSPGTITRLRAPAGPGVRDDSGAFEGWTVPTAYDALVSKVITWGPDRDGAVSRMIRALSEYDLRGISTTIEFCRELIQSRMFADGEYDTTSVDRFLDQRHSTASSDDAVEEAVAIAAALATFVQQGSASAARKPVDQSLWAQRARLEQMR
jgi:acetyl-CoA carboxylase biotin carboxylase subunit